MGLEKAQKAMADFGMHAWRLCKSYENNTSRLRI